MTPQAFARSAALVPLLALSLASAAAAQDGRNADGQAGADIPQPPDATLPNLDPSLRRQMQQGAEKTLANILALTPSPLLSVKLAPAGSNPSTPNSGVPRVNTLSQTPPTGGDTPGQVSGTPRSTQRSGGPFGWLGNLFNSGGAAGGNAVGGQTQEPSVAAAPPGTVGGAGSSNSETARRGDQAFSKAQALGDSFKNGLKTTEAIPGGADPGGFAAAGAKFAPSASSGDPAHPKNDADLMLAARTGFKSSFDVLGLRAGVGRDGRPAILNASGAPASTADLARLRGQIAADPAALMRYPQLFDAVSRQSFDKLKTSLDAPGASGKDYFKDIAKSDDKRDLDWSRSCQKISGDCNAYTKSESYKKGEYVSPQDLDKIFKAIEDDERRNNNSGQNVASRGLHFKSLSLDKLGFAASPETDGVGVAAGGSPALASPISWGQPGARTLTTGTARRVNGPDAGAPPVPFTRLGRRGNAAVVAGLAGAVLLFGWLLIKERNS